MLTGSGAKLLDFGLAKFKVVANAPVADADVTVDGTIVGTVRYMSPEQVQAQDTDARTDLFSFGSILYEMVTGKRAFAGASVAAVTAALLEREPPSTPELQSLPPLDHIVRRCLAKHPSERWQTATDVVQELKWVAQRGGIGRGGCCGLAGRVIRPVGSSHRFLGLLRCSPQLRSACGVGTPGPERPGRLH